ncbi:MAG: TIGR03435 family protein [Acidobacteriaceae bacterium]
MGMERRLAVLVLGMLAGAASGQVQKVKSMAKDAHPSYEVATIKPSDPTDQSSGFHSRERRIFIENEPMDQLIAFAYSVHPKQIVDAPDWFAKDRWDIQGMPDIEGSPDVDQEREMLRKLLAERFQLKFHRDKRELSIFAITVAKGGPKLAASKSDPDVMRDQTMNGNGVEDDYRFTNNSMAGFAEGMEFLLDRPVVDETGLKGKYDFDLKWTVDGTPPQTDPNAPPGFFTAVQEQLGLKMKATKGPAEVLVIDHAERPSAN